MMTLTSYVIAVWKSPMEQNQTRTPFGCLVVKKGGVIGTMAKTFLKKIVSNLVGAILFTGILCAPVLLWVLGF